MLPLERVHSVCISVSRVHAMRDKISKRSVDALPRGASLADTEVKGFTARRLASGILSYGFRYRDKTTGRARWLALGLHGNITPDEARALAKKHAGAVADRRDPAAEHKAQRETAKSAAAETVDAVLDAFLERHVRPALRSAKAIERAFDIYVRPGPRRRPASRRCGCAGARRCSAPRAAGGRRCRRRALWPWRYGVRAARAAP